jgi:myo-inositol catabolism protein IolC
MAPQADGSPMPLGFDEPLYVLPFDHRASFQDKMFGWKGALSAEQVARVAAAKGVIYDGFKAAIAAGVPRRKAAILVDERFGDAILRGALAEGYAFACPAETSGKDEFEFEYGEDFARHIEAFRPTFCKVLVRYNPEGDPALNERQAKQLRRLSDYLHEVSRRRFMFEMLVPAEKAQLERLHGDKRSSRMRALSPTCGRSKDSTGARTARRSWPPRAAVAGRRSAASCSDGARTRRRCASG